MSVSTAAQTLVLALALALPQIERACLPGDGGGYLLAAKRGLQVMSMRMRVPYFPRAISTHLRTFFTVKNLRNA